MLVVLRTPRLPGIPWDWSAPCTAGLVPSSPRSRVRLVLLVASLGAGCSPETALSVVADARVARDAEQGLVLDAGVILARDAEPAPDAPGLPPPDAGDASLALDASARPDAQVALDSGPRDSGVPPPADECASYPFRASTLLAEREGFGRAATGGDPARVYRVTTLADDGPGSLREALESAEPWWIVFDVEGEIIHEDRVEVRANKTVDGRGRVILIRGKMRLRDVQNVIISDVALTNPDVEACSTNSGDAINITGNGGEDPLSYTSRDIWLHHVEAYNSGDGLIDVRGGSNITISWGHFHGHKKGMLMWNTADGMPAPGMRVTLHHNYFDRITLRGPQFVYGRAHLYNNYQYRWYEYGAASLGGAQLASEGNIYEARPGRLCVPLCPDPNACGDNDLVVSKAGLIHDWDTNGAGYVRSTGDLALEDAELQENEPSMVFDPAAEYPYVAEPATVALAARIADESGPRTDYCR